MVTRGQFLERPTLIPVGKQIAEGMWHRGEKRPPLLMIPPAPADGGSMDSSVFAELAWAASSRGHPTLRFNHRGVGGSQGTRGEGGSLVEDAEAALTLLLENTGAAGICVASLAGGAATALALQRAHPVVGGLFLINPSGVDPSAFLRTTCSLLVALPEHAPALPAAALAAVVTEGRGRVEVLSGADGAFSKALPQLGQLCAAYLSEIGRNP